MANLPLKARELMRNIHKRVFMTFLRMATNKESTVSKKRNLIVYLSLIHNIMYSLPKMLTIGAINRIILLGSS